MIRYMIEVPISVNERNVCADRIWPALASADRGKTLVQVTAPLPMYYTRALPGDLER
jgi:hypothetical protein